MMPKRIPSKTTRQLLPLLVLLTILIGAVIFGAIAIIPKLASLLPSNTQSTSSSAASSPDSRPLEVRVVKPEREVFNPYTEVTVIANKTIKLDGDSNRIELVQVGEGTKGKYYVARVTNLAVDKTEAMLKLTDEAGNKYEQKLTITRSAFVYPAGYKEIKGWPDASYVVEPETFTGQLDKQHRLLEDYEPDDLVDLNKELGLYTFNNAVLRREAGTELARMLRDMRTEIGDTATVASGYRSFTEQMGTHAGILIRQGEQKGLAISAKPGHSEHQLGTTFDLTHSEVNFSLVQAFETTKVGQWLVKNSQRYGFIRSLNEQQTNYIYEPWHFRYVGTEQAGDN